MTSGIIDAILSEFSGEVEHGAGATADEISICGRALGIEFQGSFLEYLTKFGWLNVGSSEIFGLGEGLATGQRMKENTESERVEMHPPLPPYLVTFYNDGFGNQHCLDAREIIDNEHRIVFWNHELGPDQTPEFIYSSFAEWLRLLVAEEQNDE